MDITQEMWDQVRMHASIVRNKLWHQDEFDRAFKATALIDRYASGERSEELYNAMKNLSW